MESTPRSAGVHVILMGCLGPPLLWAGVVAVVVGWLSGGVPPLLGAAAPVLLVISWLVGRVRVTDAAEASGQRQYLSTLVLLNFLIVVAALILWWAK